MLKFVTFISVVVFIFVVLNFYLFARVAYLFKIDRGLFFYILLVLLSLSFPAAAAINSVYSNIITKTLHSLAAYWIGIGFLLICWLFVYEIISIFFSLQRRPTGIVILAVTILTASYAIINARTVRLTIIDLPAKLNASIVQISDVHLASTGTAFLKKLIQRTNKLNPDVVLITGDLFDLGCKVGKNDIAVLNLLDAPAFFVPGNHERYLGLEKVTNLLGTTKIKVLRNRTADFNGILIIGIDDSTDDEQVAGQLKNLDLKKSAFKILMYHRPQGLEAAAEAGIDLMLSGHTHNGQIFPFNFIVRLMNRRMKGLFQHRNCLMYVTSGSGTWGPRMRLGSKNEIVLLRLKKNDTHPSQ